MQSKSFQTNSRRLDVKEVNKRYDFVNFYESTAATYLKSDNKNIFDNNLNQIGDLNRSRESEKTPNKKKNKIKNNSIDVSAIDANTSNFIADVPLNDSKFTSTPKLISKKSGEKVKSIMKIKPDHNDTLDKSTDSVSSVSSAKRKKRNKSVSFMLDDSELVVKRSKSNSSDNTQQSLNEKTRIKKIKKKKLQKQSSAEKENETTNSISNITTTTTTTGDMNTSEKITHKPHKAKLESMVVQDNSLDTEKRKKKKPRKLNKIDKCTPEEITPEPSTKESGEQVFKKSKKKKRQTKRQDNVEDIGEEGPANKNRKTEKPDMIAESLENLNIGDNAHTLTDLIDKMIVVDKNKKKKKKKSNKKKEQTNNKDTPKDENTEEEKEKVKWVKKKWNKGRREAFIQEGRLLTSVIIENLPLTVMLDYKNIVSQHFSACGQIRQIGVAELYPADSPKPVFNTTILFDSEDAATKALEEDNMVLTGNRIRVKRPLSQNETTIVVKSYAELTEQTLSTLFSSAGRIRRINQLLKGKKPSSTAFIEFDSPEAVERAIKSAEGVQVNRKKVHVFKYNDQYGAKNKKENKKEDKNESNESE